MKTATILFFFLILFISCGTKKDRILSDFERKNYIPYYLKVYQADSLFLINKYDKSFFMLDSLFKKFEPINMEGYYEYSNYLVSGVMSNKIKNVRKKSKFCIKNFGDILVLSTPELSPVLRNCILKESGLSLNKVEKLKQKYNKKININLRKKIELIVEEDMNVRINSKDDNEYLFFQKKHEKELEKILKDYGYPNHNIVGSENYFEKSADIMAVLMHQSDSSKIKLLPRLLIWTKEGKCNPLVYSSVYDKRLYVNENKDFYGTFLYDKSVVNPVLIDPVGLDSIRNTIGLPKINYHIWREKILFGN